MASKTFNVDKFRVRVNEVLAISIVEPEIRAGWIRALEHVLHETGNYRGFRYLTHRDVPSGQRPGINISPIDGQHLESMLERFRNTDPTRVFYT